MIKTKQRESIIDFVAATNKFTAQQVAVVLDMLGEGNTVPFIARYRQDKTQGLNEENIRVIQKEFDYVVKLEKRKEEIIGILTERDLLTSALEKQIIEQVKMSELENIYYPFREKKKTKATMAIAKGLEPLAIFIMSENDNVDNEATKYINIELGVENIEQAIEGALHIIAEKTMEESEIRKFTKSFIENNGIITSSIKKDAIDENKLYEIYYDFKAKIANIKPYQILAVNRAEKVKVINVKINFENNKLFDYYYNKFILQNNESSKLIKVAIADGYKRLLLPSVERQIRSELTEMAEKYSIEEIFKTGLKKTLLQRPLKNKKILGVDPGFVSGCKLTIIDETGKMLWKEKMYLHHKNPILKLEEAYRHCKFDVIAIGNGTASRETEELIIKFIEGKELEYIIVSESGASVYSASRLAQEEFPNLSVEERSAVSIARRLQDPLAELVKIDVKSIGVGQYQHDMNQKMLTEELTYVVEQIVNEIGVDVNTASAELLSYISGLTKTTAKNIVSYRDEHGEIKTRKEISKVKGIGPKAFEQSVGFLRIINGDNPLDKTEIHPESYKLAEKILKENNMNINELGTEEFKNSVDQVSVEETDASNFEVEQIKESLKKNTIDPREELDAPVFKKGVLKLEDLAQGEIVQGVVRNIVEFGAFVDIGLKNDALLHKTNMSSDFVNDPRDVVEIDQIIEVAINDIDLEKGRVGLRVPGSEVKNRKPRRQQVARHNLTDFEVGQEVECKVINVTEYGAFVDLGLKKHVLLHKSNMAKYFVKDPKTIVSVDDVITVAITEINTEKNTMELRLVKAAREDSAKPLSFNDLKLNNQYDATVTKVVDFGAFLNIGMDRDVLLHKSNMAEYFVKDPSTLIHAGDKIVVQIIEIDNFKKTVDLVLVKAAREDSAKPLMFEDLKVGDTFDGVVTKIMNFGAFINIGMERDVLLHKSKLSEDYIENVEDFIKENEKVKVIIDSIDEDEHKVEISKVK